MNPPASGSPPACAAATFWKDAALVLGLVLLTVALYAPAGGFSAINLDDTQYVFDNPHVNTGLSVANIRWAFTHVHESWWLPLLWISYMTDVSLWGGAPGVFHWVNLLLHALNAGLLFWVLRRATGSSWASAFAAALFALHPLRVESVAWITERKDVLSGFFWMLALLVHLRQARKPSGGKSALLAGLLLLGLMSKASVVVLPAALLLLDYWPLGRLQSAQGWRTCLLEKIPLFAVAAGFTILTLTTHILSGGQVSPVTGWARLALIPGNYFPYLAKFAWPVNLSLYYVEHDAVRWVSCLAAAFALAGITLLCWRIRRRAPYLLMGWLWFLVVLLPVIRGVRLGLADYTNRFMYLPSIGLSILIAWGFSAWLCPRRGGRILLGFLAAITLGACASLTAYNLRFWRDSDAIFDRAWTLDPDNYLGITGHGLALQKQGRWPEALEFFREAANRHPDVARYRLHEAFALINMERLPEAFALLEQAAVQAPREPEIQYGLGVAFLRAERPAEALAHLARTVGLPGKQLSAYRLEWARACFETGAAAAANEQLRLAWGTPPTQSFTYADLLGFYVNLWNSGEKPRALHYFRKLAAADPGNILLLNNLAWLLATSDVSPAPPEEALDLANRALALAGAPQPILLDTLAAAQANAGDFEQAVQSAEQARALARQQGNPNLARRLEQRLEAYRQARPWREKPVS